MALWFLRVFRFLLLLWLVGVGNQASCIGLHVLWVAVKHFSAAEIGPLLKYGAISVTGGRAFVFGGAQTYSIIIRGRARPCSLHWLSLLRYIMKVRVPAASFWLLDYEGDGASIRSQPGVPQGCCIGTGPLPGPFLLRLSPVWILTKYKMFLFVKNTFKCLKFFCSAL